MPPAAPPDLRAEHLGLAGRPQPVAGRPVTLGEVPAGAWDAIAALGADAVWLMGVWRAQPGGRRDRPAPNPELVAAFRPAAARLRPTPTWWARPTASATTWSTTTSAGRRAWPRPGRRWPPAASRLLLDFVPNHVAPDHPWAHGAARAVRGRHRGRPASATPASFVRVGGHVLARGPRPVLPGVARRGAAQRLRPRAAARRRSGRSRDIAGQCDGVRCDMAMLMLTTCSPTTWGDRAGPRPPAELLGRGHPRGPPGPSRLPFVAEAYWDREWDLMQQGFDHCYDKRLYDRLVHERRRVGARSTSRPTSDYQRRPAALPREPRRAPGGGHVPARPASGRPPWPRSPRPAPAWSTRPAHRGARPPAGVPGPGPGRAASTTTSPPSTARCSRWSTTPPSATATGGWARWRAGPATRAAGTWWPGRGTARRGAGWSWSTSAQGPAAGHVRTGWDDLRGRTAAWSTPRPATTLRPARRRPGRRPLRRAGPRRLAPAGWIDGRSAPGERPMTAEHARLAEATGRAEDDLFAANPWYEWGPYLPERAWGTVREDYSADGNAWDYFPHDHARSRAYRWNEDGMAGHLRHPPRAVPGPGAVERRRPDPQGADVRPHRPPGQPRRGRQGVLVVPRRPAQPRPAALALPLPPGRLPLRAAGGGERPPRPRATPSSSCSTPACSTTTATGSSRSPTPRRRPPRCWRSITAENHGPRRRPSSTCCPTLWFRNTWAWAATSADARR